MPTELIIRSFTPDLEVRSDGDGRTIEGIVVPFEVEQRIDAALTEVFVRGAFNSTLDRPGRVKLAFGHQSQGGTLIGMATELREDAAGLWASLRVSDTGAGRDALTLVRDGVLDELSIGFRSGNPKRRANGVVERNSVDLREVAIVREGAYGRGAVVTAVRSMRDRAERARHLRASIPLDLTRVEIG